MEAYYNLALAVIEQALDDLQGLGIKRRRAAAQDIAAGGLERWVRMVAWDEQVLDRIHAKLEMLLAEAA